MRQKQQSNNQLTSKVPYFANSLTRTLPSWNRYASRILITPHNWNVHEHADKLQMPATVLNYTNKTSSIHSKKLKLFVVPVAHVRWSWVDVLALHKCKTPKDRPAFVSGNQGQVTNLNYYWVTLHCILAILLTTIIQLQLSKKRQNVQGLLFITLSTHWALSSTEVHLYALANAPSPSNFLIFHCSPPMLINEFTLMAGMFYKNIDTNLYLAIVTYQIAITSDIWSDLLFLKMTIIRPFYNLHAIRLTHLINTVKISVHVELFWQTHEQLGNEVGIPRIHARSDVCAERIVYSYWHCGEMMRTQNSR